jgi:membrane protein
MPEKMLSVEKIGRFTNFLFFQIRVWPRCIRLLYKNNALQQASVLSYTTLFAIVPLTIVMLMIFNSLGAFKDLGEPLRNFVYSQTFIKNIQYTADPNNPSEKINLSKKIDEFTTSYFKNLNTGSITIIGSLAVIWSAIAMLITIENAFNMIWNVSHGRSFIQRITYYWAFLTLGPLLFGVAVYVNTRFGILSHFKGELFSYISQIVPFAVAYIGLFALYMLMPHAKVSTGAALWGALIAAIAWTFAKWGFGLYVVKLIPYNVIYGMLGLIPISVLWVYITWLIVLFGLQLTFTTQNLRTIEEAEKAAAKRRQEYFLATDLQVIEIVKFICSAFEQKNAPVQAEIVCSQLNLPCDFTQKVLDHLVKAGLLLKTSEPTSGYAPTTIAENLNLAEIYDAIKIASFVAPGDQSEVIKQIKDAYRQTLSQYNVKNLM